MRILLSEYSGNTLVNLRGDLIKDMIVAGHEVTCTSVCADEEMKAQVNALGADFYSVAGYQKSAGNKSKNRVWKRIKMLLNYIMLYKVIKPELSFLCLPKASILCSIAAIICRSKHINILITGPEPCYYRKGIMNALGQIFYKLMYRFILNRCETVFFQNYDDYYRFKFRRMVTKEQAEIIHGAGVNMAYFNLKPMPNTDVVCMTASLIKRKGVRTFIEAAKIVRKKYPKVRFLLIGNTEGRPDAIPEDEINRAAEQGTVYFCDYAKDVRPYLEVCSVYVLPSYHEGNLRSILEAEAVGRPIITTTAPGCREAVISGFNGFLVAPGDAKALAEKIILLLENKEMKLRMAQNSYQLCRERFDVKKINQIMLDRMKLSKI